MPTPLTTETAEVVWQILVDYAGAPGTDDSWMKDSFMAYVTEPSPLYEFRFQGKLGFGGKFYIEHNGWRVSYYGREDYTTERDYAVKTTNLVLEGAYRAHNALKDPTHS